jgi:hypothetical protein
MYRFILFWALMVLLAAPAFAADTNRYPYTLIDQTCTDSYDVPAATTPGLVTIGIGGAYQPPPAAQISGSGDGYCDNDSRIVTGNITADTLFGPFQLPEGARGFLLFWDLITISGGATNDMNFRIYVKKPHNLEDAQISAVTTTIDAAADVYYDFGPAPLDRALQGPASEVAVIFPKPFYIHLNVLTATLVNGELSIMPTFY